MDFREHVVLAPLTTFRIGGPARWFAEARTEAEVAEAVCFAKDMALPLLVLGSGSNLLVSDAGFPGLALHIALPGIATRQSDPSTRDFIVAAGEDWDAFVTHAVAQGYAGIECLAGIPGTVGGTPVQNVGAYGQEVSDTIVSVRVLERTTLRIIELPASAVQFSYRSSIFNSILREHYIILQVTFKLKVQQFPRLAYKDLKLHFKDEACPALADVVSAVRSIRAGKGMLLVAGDTDCQSAGSFFKNPIVPATQIEAIAARAGVKADEVPAYPAGAGRMKVPAAWLLEQAGFRKGFRRGRAAFSSKHTLALTNLGGATAAEVLSLRDEVTAGVFDTFDIRLETEPVLVGI